MKTQGLRSPEAASLHRVLRYLWEEERSDFLSRPREERVGHIYPHLVVLRRWLKRERCRNRPSCPR